MNKIAFFDDNGMLENVHPRTHDHLYEDRDTAYHADFFFIFQKLYDLSDIKSVSEIPVPKFKATSNILELSYIIKIRCELVNDIQLLQAFVNKTLELMWHSKFLWARGDYLQVIRNHYRIGCYKEGDEFESLFRQSHPSIFQDPHTLRQEGDHLATKYYFENRNRRYAEYEAAKKVCPDLVPNTVKGYLQIRTRRTKRFLEIQAICEKHGYSFNFSNSSHYCRKFDTSVQMSISYDHQSKNPHVSSCMCSLYANHICKTGMDEYSLSCIYDPPDSNSCIH